MYFCRTNKAEQYFDIAMDLYFHKGVGATQIIRLPPEKPLLNMFRGGFLILYPKSYPKKVDVIPKKNHLESNDPKLPKNLQIL